MTNPSNAPQPMDADLDDILHALTHAEPPAGMQQRVLANLANQPGVATHPHPTPTARQFPTRPAFLLPSLAIAAALLFAVALSNRKTHPALSTSSPSTIAHLSEQIIGPANPPGRPAAIIIACFRCPIFYPQAAACRGIKSSADPTCPHKFSRPTLGPYRAGAASSQSRPPYRPARRRSA